MKVVRTRILVCGSRHWSAEWMVHAILNAELQRHTLGLVIISGMAPGADTHAADWARESRRWLRSDGHGGVVTDRQCQVVLKKFPADWDQYGKAAGPIRNKQMLVEGRPHKVYAFSNDIVESRGTRNMVEQARKAGVPVSVIGECRV